MIVKSARAVGRAAGAIIDEEDRKLLGIVITLAITVVGLAGLFALAVAIAIRVFEAVAG